MALTISIETTYGLTHSEAHIIIREFRMTKEIAEDGTKTFSIEYAGLVYVDAAKYTADKSPISGFNFSFPLVITEAADQTNLLKQCYLNLKTQDGFTDAVDA